MSKIKPVLSMPVLLKRATNIVVLLYICGSFFAAHAEMIQKSSKRIEVYSLSQNYWDTQNGDTLGEIVLHLLPNNPAKHEKLKQDIVQLNPEAFIGGNPEKLLAGKRLWLPGYMKQADSKADPETTVVERYSWGNIKRPRE
jgi:hypothetical protein